MKNYKIKIVFKENYFLKKISCEKMLLNAMSFTLRRFYADPRTLLFIYMADCRTAGQFTILHLHR